MNTTNVSEDFKMGLKEGKLQAQKEEVKFLKMLLKWDIDKEDATMDKPIKERIQALNQSQTKQKTTTLRKEPTSSEPKCPSDKPDCNIQNKQEAKE